MRYLGGKYRIRKWLAAQIAPYRTPGHILWEPFCGGLNASEALQPDICSDIDESLIALYQAVRAGWEPPTHVDAELYAFARTLPESNPLHGFCAFGCSFGGKKWGGLARGGENRNYAQGSANALRKAINRLTEYLLLDFLEIEPYAIEADIYCDPPYRDSTAYTHKFDFDRFVARARDWAAFTAVIVSEYTWPANAGTEIAACERNLELQSANRSRVERLFLVTP